MAKGSNLASIAFSLSLAALLIWMAWPQDLPAQDDRQPQRTETAEQPRPVPRNAKPADKAETPGLAAIVLPPPPPAPVPDRVESRPAPAPKAPPRTEPKPAPQNTPAPQVAARVTAIKPVSPTLPQAPATATTTKPVRAIKPMTPAKRDNSPKAAKPRQPKQVAPMPASVPETAKKPAPEPVQAPALERQVPEAAPDPLPAGEARKIAETAARQATAAQRHKETDWRKQADRQRPEDDAPQRVAVSTASDSRDARTGRVLLRLIEHGQGPTIEIAWPGSAARNEKLYQRLRSCFGMVNAIVTGDGRLYSMQSPVGRNWIPNIDRYSGFVRQPAGRPVAAEQRNASDIRRRHGLGRGGNLVRVFPRNVDAAILGGLQIIVGNNYRAAKTIHAAYRIVGGQLEVTNIIADGTSYSETITIAPVRRCGDV